MKKRPLPFVILILCAIFLITSSYTDYDELLEVDFLAALVKYEQGDAENISFDKNHFTVHINSLVISTCLTAHINDPASVTLSRNFISEPQSFILRC